ncbi:MAG: FAD-dependent oxidoreductase [Oscillatoria sp. PMC 1068.18]|nr:FAD-dependent oxidoreductase [Oscillatoria sp. PMC 1076.18]MEC4987813.1 FAD-dependent oxidoreductase [Oscillatoria sp. PMC 1068.18]
MSDISAVVAQVSDLQDGEMQQVEVGKQKVLLAKIDGKYHATGAFCTHQSAPLAQGILSKDRVICPWHNAAYNPRTGEQYEPPGLDCLTHFQVHLEGENVIVTIPENFSSQHPPQMGQQNLEVSDKIFVILGSGAAGVNAAEALRHEGFQGRIIMITSEEKLPYDRVVMSKQYLQGSTLPKDSLPLRDADFYNQNNIELLTGKFVIRVDAETKQITFADNSTINYDSLLLATGAKANKLKVPGADLANIFTLRSYQDSDEIVTTAESDKKAVIVGSSFIGMETAASLTKQGVSVTVVSPEKVPFKQLLGEKIGKLYQKIHEENGVTFQFETKATEFVGKDKVEAVILENGEKIPADLVIVGIGVKPATDYLEKVELNEKDNSINTDEYLQVTDSLYAAGDLATFPYWYNQEPTRIEHWRLAAQHGRIAAKNMAGKRVKYEGVPFFWTAQFTIGMRYVGHVEDWEETIVQGDLSESEFLAFYVKNKRILAVAANGFDREIAAISELMRLQKMPEVEQVREGNFDWFAALSG